MTIKELIEDLEKEMSLNLHQAKYGSSVSSIAEDIACVAIANEQKRIITILKEMEASK